MFNFFGLFGDDDNKGRGRGRGRGRGWDKGYHKGWHKGRKRRKDPEWIFKELEKLERKVPRKIAKAARKRHHHHKLIRLQQRLLRLKSIIIQDEPGLTPRINALIEQVSRAVSAKSPAPQPKALRPKGPVQPKLPGKTPPLKPKARVPVAANVPTPCPRLCPRGCKPLPPGFNEAAYLARHKDVARAIRHPRSRIKSGADHYRCMGWREGRQLAGWNRPGNLSGLYSNWD
jgi:hypothetical protein